jgi:hypothetical protein
MDGYGAKRVFLAFDGLCSFPGAGLAGVLILIYPLCWCGVWRRLVSVFDAECSMQK